MAKDFLFKTIEFSKVDKETPYMITRIRPIFSSEVYAEHPDKKFEYTSVEKMESDLMDVLHYTAEQISLLPVESITSYYEPLYTIKWYIGGLFDFFQTNRYIRHPSATIIELFKPLIDDSKIDIAQNESLGFTFPERMMKLIRNKPVNRIRMFVNAAPLTVVTISQLAKYDNFRWITTNQFNPNTTTGLTVGIKIPGSTDNDNYNTYQWVVFAPTTDPDGVSTQYNRERDKYIGISCNNIGETVLITKDGDWPYSWTELPTSESDTTKLSYIDLGIYRYNCYIRYSNNKKTLSTNAFDSSGYLYTYLGICITFDAYGYRDIDITNPDNYKWAKISDFSNVQKYDVNAEGKRYYLYARFGNNNRELSNSYIPGVSLNLYISFFNETDNISNNHIFNDISLYEGIISLNIYDKRTYNHGGQTKYAWIKFSDKINATSSLDFYDYGIYKDGTNLKLRRYLYVSYDHTANDELLYNYTNYYKIDLSKLTNAESYTNTAYDKAGNALTNNFIYVKFYNNIGFPQVIEECSNKYVLKDTLYILISITDKNGAFHTVNDSTGSEMEDYSIAISMRKLEVPTAFEKRRYTYFTYIDEIADPKKRSQYPTVYENGEYRNKKHFGYSYVNKNPLSNIPEQETIPDETSREITLYRAKGLNTLTEANITKITTIDVPYNTMGKFSVFNFDPIILADNEYLIIGGNRDNTCALVCNDSFEWSSSDTHPDYTLQNTDNDSEHGERKEVNRSSSNPENIMYYTQVNFINNTGWEPVYDRYLPIDIGCGYASASNQVHVTTKGFNDIIEETRVNDAATLKAYLEEKLNDERYYKSPNYDLYVNLTYKFAKIIDGNIDYMPLYNRYKIKYKFKNENQVILEKKVFDTSIITPDGSVYDKPNNIEINGVVYEKISRKYIDYFDYIEGEFTDTIKATDVAADVNDDDYDVAYFQCDNILKQIYQTNTSNHTSGSQFDENYYNYKWLADDVNNNKDKLPVLCEITISAYDTATPLFTRIVPVSLAAYSLIEVTDDYIKTTVSKIENDYIYGLTQRTSRIEQYADRISMSVLNIGQGLYSQIRMTEDRILMEVVDASKQVGSAINMYSDKIQSMVYDVSNNMYSQILVEKQKISLEVSNNFRKAGIYLYDDTAKIDAPNIILRGDRTTIYNTLTIKQGQAEGIVMLDSSKADRIHITVDNIPDRDTLSTPETNSYISFDTNTRQLLKGQTLTKEVINDILAHTKITTVNNRHAVISSMSLSLYVNIPSLGITWMYIDKLISWKNVNPTLKVIEGERRYVDTPSGSRNITNNDNEIVYGAAMPSATFKWEYNNKSLSKIDPETIYAYTNFTTHVFPELHFSGINYSNIALNTDALNNSGLFTNIGLLEKNNNYATLNCTLSGTTGIVEIIASYTQIDENTEVEYADECKFYLEVATYTSSFGWYVDEVLCGNNIQYIYYDDIQNSKLPYIKISGNDIRMVDINISINFNGLTPFITAGNDGKLSFTSNTVGTIPQDTTKNIVVTATYTINSNDITQSVTIGISSVGGGTYIDDIIQRETEWVYDLSNALILTLKLNESGYYYKDKEDIKELYFENPENDIAFEITTALNFITSSITYFYDRHCADAEGWVHKYTDGYYYTQPATPSGGGSYMSMEAIDLSPNSTTNLITLVFKKDEYAYFNAIRFIMNPNDGWSDADASAANFLNISKIWIALSDSKTSHTTESEELIYDKSIVDKTNNLVFFDTHYDYLVFIKDGMLNLYVNKDYIFIIILLIPTSTRIYFTNIFLDTIGTQYYYEYIFLWKHINYASSIWEIGLPADGEIKASASLNLDFNFTKGTRIGKNGIYSYTSDNTLFYITTDLIEQRMENNGIRMAKWVSDSYAGSSALEVYYGGQNETDSNYWWRWDNTNYWVSLFNYKPLLRFYATLKGGNVDGLNFHVPALHKTLNTNTGKWEGGNQFWRYENRYDIIAEDDYGPYYWWDYDLSYHRGDISIELVDNAGVTHIITLPMSENDDGWQRPTYTQPYENLSFQDQLYGGYRAGWYAVVKNRYGGYKADPLPKIPVGFTINIMNSLYCSSDLNIAKSSDKFTVGTPKARIVITTITQNCNFLKRRRAEDGTFKNWRKDGWNYGTENHHVYCNFLDAHGDYCSYIEMSHGDRRYYLGDVYHDNSFATFVWNGFIWKSSIDVESNGQLNVANNG